MAFCGKIHGLAYGGYIGNCRFSVALVDIQAHFQLFSLIFGRKLMSVICRHFCFVGDDDDDDDEGSSGEDDDEVVEAEGTSCILWYSI